MAVLKNVVLAASLLAPFTLAIPMMDKRAIYTHTETAIAWVTIEETTTVYVDPAQQTPPPEAAPAPVTSVPAANFAVTSEAPSTLATLVATSSSVEAPPAPPAPVASQPAPVVPSQPAPVASSSAPAVAPAAPAQPSSVAVQPKDTDITASASADCESTGSACSGDVTHWDGGLGACGWNVNTASDMAIALPFEFMGTQSNGNPYCGRSVTLVNPTSGTTVQATVGDKCMGCTGRAIDCTDALFSAITDGKGDGRLSGIEWYFN